MSKALKKMAVVASSDSGWAWQSIFVVNRAVEMDPTGTLEGHVFVHGAVDPRLLKAVHPRVTFHSVEEVPAYFEKMLEINPRIPGGSLLRFTALDILSAQYERIFYLDGDVFQFWGNIYDLASVDMTDFAVAGVLDQFLWYLQPVPKYIRYRKSLGMRRHTPYMNAGVMMVNGPKFLEQKIAERSFEYFNTNFGVCKFGDQSALNAILRGHWASLSLGWNYQTVINSLGMLNSRRPRLVHFTGVIKPWSDHMRVLPHAAFDAMYEFLAKWDLLDLLGENSPLSYKPAEQEAQNIVGLQKQLRRTVREREQFSATLDRLDFADYAVGLKSMR